VFQDPAIQPKKKGRMPEARDQKAKNWEKNKHGNWVMP